MAKLLTKREAIERAIAAGASIEDIEREAAHQRRHVGSVPFNHMIRALNTMTWHNSRDESNARMGFIFSLLGPRLKNGSRLVPLF